MLETLRKMSIESKKKVVAICASFLTLVILGIWGVHSFGPLASALESTKSQGVAVFAFLEQNVERAYDAFQSNAPSFNTVGADMANTEASSTDVMGMDESEEATTTQSEDESGFMTGQVEQ
jgi:hypothetical protein